MDYQEIKDFQIDGDRLPESITDASYQIRNGFLTSEMLIQRYLERIHQLEPKLNAFITIFDKPIEVAAALDAELKGKNRGVLHGIPLVIKDNFDTVGTKTTVGSQLFFNRVPQEDAVIVKRLQSAGAILLGKTNMTEFASSVAGHNRFYGDTHNLVNLSHSPGGSSGGTACAIAAKMCLGGMGTDTGGSIRIPASWTGIVGLRPTSGLVNMAGVYPRSFTMDVAGPLASCVADVAILLDAIVGGDRNSKSSYNDDLQKGVKGLRLGVIKNYTYKGVEPEVAQAIYRAINTFTELEAEVITIDIPWLTDNLDFSAYFNIVLYEFNQILGEEYRAVKGEDIFSSLVRDNIERGMKISPTTYEEALRERRSQIEQFTELFKECDALLTPTTPIVAPLLSANYKIFYQTRQFALPFSFMGVPAISVPCGFNSQGLPIGMQVVGNSFQEALIIRIAAAFENASKGGLVKNQ